VAAAACGGSDTGTGPGGTPRDALIALPRTDVNPPAARTFTVRNDQPQTFRLTHSDGAGTLFAEFLFTPGSILSVNGAPVCATCSVSVTITPFAGLYGFTVSPASLVFSAVGSPVVTLSYGTYGDLSVHAASPRYPTPADYSQALAVWYELAPGLWREERNSGHVSGTTVASAVDIAVPHLLAAPR
jgi:hypothetical protein